MVMYDWSQYRPYQRGDPSTCKPIFGLPEAGECDPGDAVLRLHDV